MTHDMPHSPIEVHYDGTKLNLAFLHTWFNFNPRIYLVDQFKAFSFMAPTFCDILLTWLISVKNEPYGIIPGQIPRGEDI